MSSKNNAADTKMPQGESERGDKKPLAWWPFFFACILLGWVVLFGLWAILAIWAKVEQHAFDAMTPAQHLDAARAALADKRLDDGLYQLSAIKPEEPESAAAKALQEELAAAKGAEAAAKEVEASTSRVAQEAARIAERQRQSAVEGLQARLNELGYAVTVARSDKPGEIVITSNDFGDTDHRVRFLGFLRGRNSPATSACFAGFYTVRLSSGMLSPILGFSEAYSLDCFGSR